MATIGNAIAALLFVGQKQFEALGSTVPQYGDMYVGTRWIDQYDFDAYSWRSVCIYEQPGTFIKQGLGYSKEWLYQKLVLDIYMPSLIEARQAFQKLREFWIQDFDYPFALTGSGDGTLGKGYLRNAGIKRIEIGTDRSLPIERGTNQFRRVANLTVEIGD